MFVNYWRVQHGGKRKFFTKRLSVMTRSFRHRWKNSAWIPSQVSRRFACVSDSHCTVYMCVKTTFAFNFRNVCNVRWLCAVIHVVCAFMPFVACGCDVSTVGSWMAETVWSIWILLGNFTTRRYANAVYAVVMCLSVCHKSVLSTWLNLGSREQCHTIIAQGSSFLVPKISAKFRRNHLQWGCQMEVG